MFERPGLEPVAIATWLLAPWRAPGTAEAILGGRHAERQTGTRLNFFASHLVRWRLPGGTFCRFRRTPAWANTSGRPWDPLPVPWSCPGRVAAAKPSIMHLISAPCNFFCRISWLTPHSPAPLLGTTRRLRHLKTMVKYAREPENPKNSTSYQPGGDFLIFLVVFLFPTLQWVRLAINAANYRSSAGHSAV